MAASSDLNNGVTLHDDYSKVDNTIPTPWHIMTRQHMSTTHMQHMLTTHMQHMLITHPATHVNNILII